MRRTPLERRTPMRRTGPPTRKPYTPSKPRRRPKPGREFWAHQREQLYARAAGRCELGGCDLNHSGMEAHHRKLRSQGGDHGLSNLVALCPAHHACCHAHPEAARERGFIVPSQRDSRVTAVVLADGRAVLLDEDGGYDVVPFAAGEAS